MKTKIETEEAITVQTENQTKEALMMKTKIETKEAITMKTENQTKEALTMKTENKTKIKVPPDKNRPKPKSDSSRLPDQSLLDQANIHHVISCKVSAFNGRWLGTPEQYKVIDYACLTSGLIAPMACDLIQLYLVDCMENHRPLPNLNSVFVLKAIKMLGTNTNKGTHNRLKVEFPDIWNLQEQLAVPAKPYIGGMHPILRFIAVEIMTSFSNFNDYALNQHIKTYLSAKYDIGKGHAGWILGTMYGIQRNKIPSKLLEKYDEATLLSIITEEKTRLPGNGHERNVQCVRYRYHMLKTIEEINRKNETLDKKKYKTFRLFPERKAGRAFITLDNDGVTQLKQTAEHLGVQWITEPSIGKLYNHDGLISKTTPSKSEWRIGASVQTDAVQLKVDYIEGRVKAGFNPNPGASKKLYKAQMLVIDPEYKFKYGTDADWIAGCDPGNHDFIVVVYPADENGHHGVYSVSRGQWREMSGAALLTNRMKKLAERPDVKLLEEQWAQLYTKTSSFQACFDAVKGRFSLYPQRARVYSNLRIAKLRFTVYRKRQQALDQICKEMTKNGKYAIAFGDGSKTTGIKGTPPGGPVRELRRKLRTQGYNAALANERYTTKRCNCCEGQDHLKMKGRKARRKWKEGDSDDTRITVNGVLHCTKCGKTWDRDVNAAINILRVGVAMAKGAERPSYLEQRKDEKFAKLRNKRRMTKRSGHHNRKVMKVDTPDSNLL